MNVPKNLLYTKSHEWVEMLNDKTLRTGLTEYATVELGELVFINLPEVGDEVEADENFADVESVKAVSDVVCPATGEISAINEALLDAPGYINTAPYESWLVEIKNVSKKRELLSAAEYEKLLAEEA